MFEYQIVNRFQEKLIPSTTMNNANQDENFQMCCLLNVSRQSDIAVPECRQVLTLQTSCTFSCPRSSFSQRQYLQYTPVALTKIMYNSQNIIGTLHRAGAYCVLQHLNYITIQNTYIRQLTRNNSSAILYVQPKFYSFFARMH